MNPPEREPNPVAVSESYKLALERAAARVRIEPEYWDIWGKHHPTSRRTKEAILTSLGFDIQALEESLARLEQAEQATLLDPTSVVTWTGRTLTVPVRLPEGYRTGGTLHVAVYTEDSKSHRADYPAETIENSLPVPGLPPLGYHDLEVVLRHPTKREIRASQRLVVAPARAWMPDLLQEGGRTAGLAISLYGVRSARNWGAGDFTDLLHIVEWVHSQLGAGFVALNPLHAIANRQPYNTSPYLPLSSYYRNYLYLDIEAIPEYANCHWARTLVSSAKVQAEIRSLRESEYVEYERVAHLKLTVLRLLYREFQRDDGLRSREFRHWAAEQGDLLDRFAVYCALDEVIHQKQPNVWIWPDWPEEYRDASSPAVRQFARSHHRLVDFYKYVQWQIDVQLAQVQGRSQELGMPIGLYHDLALATDSCGADLWAYRRFFVDGCRVGAPPDDFAPDGQDWAFPPPNTEAHREDGYALYIATIRQNSRHGGALRIDHVMRFYRLFWIPNGLSAKDGTYVRDRFHDLLGILALESHRGKFIVVGEDLGTVPDEMRAAIEECGIFSYKLFYFEKDNNGYPRPSAEYARQALVSSTTHDLPTLGGFWAARDIELRRQVGFLRDDATYWRQIDERKSDKRRMLEALIREGLLPPNFPREAAEWTELTGELHNAVIGYLMKTPSQLMLLNQEDLTKELDQQNLPGTTGEYPNWRRKMRLTIEELQSGPAAAGFCEMFRNWLTREGRLTGGSAAPQK